MFGSFRPGVVTTRGAGNAASRDAAGCLAKGRFGLIPEGNGGEETCRMGSIRTIGLVREGTRSTD